MLYYLSTARLPSKKAHAIQQMNMCQAFAAAGEDVCFVTPSVGAKQISWEDVSEYYGLSAEFSLKTVPGPSRNYRFPNYPLPDLDTQLYTYWLAYMYLSGSFDSDDIIFSRNLAATRLLLKLLGRFGINSDLSIWFEQHQVDRGAGSEFYQHLDGLVCISSCQKKQMTESLSIDPENVFVAHDGVDLTAYQGASTNQARERLGFDPDERIVMYTGHLYPSKDIRTLVRAADEFDATVYIVGGYEEDISRIKAEEEIPANVTFTGFVPPSDIPLYQTAADILVATVAEKAGRYEFFSPLKLFEYMAAGKPLVVSRKESYEEVVSHGQNGLFVPPESPDDLAATVDRLLANPVLGEQLGQQAQSDARQYGWRTRAQRILNRITATSDQASPALRISE